MKKSLRFIQSAFTVFALLCLVYFSWQSKDLLQTLLAQTQWLYLAFAVLFGVLVHPACILITQFQLKTLYAHLTYQQVFYIHTNRLPARYVPGGIWHFVSKVVDFHQLGIKKSQLGSLFLLEILQASFMSFLIGGSLIFYFRGIDEFWGSIAALAAVLSLFGILLLPWAWKLFNLPPLDKRQYFKAASSFFLIWFASSSAFICYLSAFPNLLNQTRLLEVVGTHIFSWAVGNLMIFAPQGIGVFEVVSSSLLNLSVQLVDAAIIIAGFRVVTLVGDIGLWAIVKIIYKPK